MATRLPKVAFDGRLMTEDAATKGWDPRMLADLSDGRLNLRTVYRFLSNEVQTVKTARELARILGRPISRYVLRSRDQAVA